MFICSSSHFYVLVSGIPDLSLRTLEMVIRICFRDATSLTICSWHDVTLSQFVQQMYSMHSKCLPFTNIS